MSMKTFTAGERLFAADLNDNFDETKKAGNITSGTINDARIPNLAASKITSGTLAKARLPAGTILNVVQAVKTDTFVSTSASFTTVTGLSVTITPSSAASKVLIIAQISHGRASNSFGWGHFKVTRAGTDIYRGAAAGSRTQAIFGGFDEANIRGTTLSSSIVYLDSPATTSATTYRVEGRTAGAGSFHVNRSELDGNDNGHTRGASSITVIEVAG